MNWLRALWRRFVPASLRRPAVRCDTCRFRPNVECRRMPPLVISVPAGESGSGHSYRHHSKTVWPEPADFHWCGEWEERT